MSQLCKVIITGELLAGSDKGPAVKQLAGLFKCPPQKAAALLSGRPTPVGKPMQRPMAEQYCAKLRAIGVDCNIVTTGGGDTSPQEDSRDILPLLVEERSRKAYARRFQRFDKRGGRWFPSLNPVALLLPMLWFIYRGLPLPAIVCGIAYATGNYFVIAAVHVLAALSADYLYYRRLCRYRERYAMASAELRKRILTRGAPAARGTMIAAVVSMLLLVSYAVYSILDVDLRLRHQEAAQTEQANKLRAERERRLELVKNAPLQLKTLGATIRQRLLEEDAKNSGVGFPDSREELITGLELDAKAFRDVWNGQISYEHTRDGFRLHSPGPDGSTGGGDDIFHEEKVQLTRNYNRPPPGVRPRPQPRTERSMPAGVFGGSEAQPTPPAVAPEPPPRPRPPESLRPNRDNTDEDALPPGVFGGPG